MHAVAALCALAAAPSRPHAPRRQWPAQCASDDDCSLLGRCAGGTCNCSVGWRGSACSVADLTPLDPALGYHNETAASWGGRPMLGSDGCGLNWHLFVTQIEQSCPLILFQYNSAIVRAVSKTGGPGGPYEWSETVFPPFHHNPTAVGPTPDGMYLLFFIGNTNASGVVDCSSGIPSVPFHPDPALPSNGYITMAWANDVGGPWQQRVILRDNGPGGNHSNWHYFENNPAAAVLPNGTVVVAFRANHGDNDGSESLGIAVAPHWSAEFVPDAAPIISPQMSGGASNEDPFMWVAGDGSWHIVAHQQQKGNVCGDNTAGHSCGAHLFAHSPHGPWVLSPDPVYSAHVTLTNGSTAEFQTRQRPQIVFDVGTTTPRYLFTGGSFEGNNPDTHMLTHTYAQEFDVPLAAAASAAACRKAAAPSA